MRARHALWLASTVQLLHDSDCSTTTQTACRSADPHDDPSSCSWSYDSARIVESFLAPAECHSLVSEMQILSSRPAAVASDGSLEYRPLHRRSTEFVLDRELHRDLYARAAAAVLGESDRGIASSQLEDILLVKYEQGEYFKW